MNAGLWSLHWIWHRIRIYPCLSGIYLRGNHWGYLKRYPGDHYPRVGQLIPFLPSYLLWKIKQRISSLSLIPFGSLSLSLPFGSTANRGGSEKNDLDILSATGVLVSISASWQPPSVYLSSPKSVKCWVVVNGVTPFFLSLRVCLFNQSLLQLHVW